MGSFHAAAHEENTSQCSMCSPREMASYYSLKEETEGEEEGYRCFLNQNIDLFD